MTVNLLTSIQDDQVATIRQKEDTSLSFPNGFISLLNEGTDDDQTRPVHIQDNSELKNKFDAT